MGGRSGTGRSGTAPEPRLIGKAGTLRLFDGRMAKPTEQRKGNTTKANPTPQQSAAPNLLQRLQQRRPATLGACRASIRVRNDTDRLSPGPALLMFAKYSVGAQRAAPAPTRHSLCPKTTLYFAGINNFLWRLGRLGRLGTAPEPPNLGSSGKRGKAGTLRLFDGRMSKPTEQRKGTTTKTNPTPQQSAAPNLFNAFSSAGRLPWERAAPAFASEMIPADSHPVQPY